MGFLDVLGRMARGEPAFQDEGASHPQQPAPSAEPKPSSAIRKNESSSFPVVKIRRAKTHGDSVKIQVYCQIASSWPEEIELDKIRIFNTTRELDVTLRPYEEREFLVYDGPALLKEYHEIQLDYKTHKEGDYFQAVHDVTFAYNPADKTYTVSDIYLHEPIRDIYG